MPNWVVFHLWNLFMIVDAISKYIWFHTNLMGHYTVRRGILSMYSQELMTVGILCLYMYYFCAGTERQFAVQWLFKLQVVSLCVAMLCYGVDGLLYCFDYEAFCKM